MVQKSINRRIKWIDLGGNDETIPGDFSLWNPTAEIVLAGSARGSTLWHGVHFGWVEEVDAAMEGLVEKVKWLTKRVLLTESHGSCHPHKIRWVNELNWIESNRIESNWIELNEVGNK